MSQMRQKLETILHSILWYITIIFLLINNPGVENHKSLKIHSMDNYRQKITHSGRLRPILVGSCHFIYIACIGEGKLNFKTSFRRNMVLCLIFCTHHMNFHNRNFQPISFKLHQLYGNLCLALMKHSPLPPCHLSPPLQQSTLFLGSN